MTARELIAHLAGMPPDYPVVLAKDGEGNDFSPLAELSREQYVPLTAWNGHIKIARDAPDTVVLWPTN